MLVRDHQRVRGAVFAVSIALLGACSGEATGASAGARAAAASAESEDPNVAASTPAAGGATSSELAAAAAAEAVEAIASSLDAPTDAGGESETGADESNTAEGAVEDGTEGDAADEDSPLPQAPEPGSVEADAELLALLDESTLTQEEFDRGFGRGAPGPSAPGAERPEVRLGERSGLSEATVTTLELLIEGEQHKLATCVGMALTKDAGATGSLTLAATLDARGEVTKVEVGATGLGGAAEISASLAACLASVVEAWTLPKAANSVEIPLRVTTQG